MSCCSCWNSCVWLTLTFIAAWAAFTSFTRLWTNHKFHHLWRIMTFPYWFFNRFTKQLCQCDVARNSLIPRRLCSKPFPTFLPSRVIRRIWQFIVFLYCICVHTICFYWGFEPKSWGKKTKKTILIFSRAPFEYVLAAVRRSTTLWARRKCKRKIWFWIDPKRNSAKQQIRKQCG